MIRQPLSAYRLLGGRGGTEDWEQRTDPKSNQKYWYNSKKQLTQWERPAEMTGSRCSLNLFCGCGCSPLHRTRLKLPMIAQNCADDQVIAPRMCGRDRCARFSFWVAVDMVQRGEEECRLQQGLVQSLPTSLDVPGMLGLHRTAYLHGNFPVLMAPGAESAALDAVRLTVKEPSVLRVVVASNAGEQGALSAIKLYTSEGEELQEKLVDVATQLGPEFKKVEWGQTQYGNRVVLTAVIGDNLGPGYSERYVLGVHHWLGGGMDTEENSKKGGCSSFMLQLSIQPVAELMSKEDRDRECPGSDVWPSISSALTSSMYACDEASTDSNFRCLTELTTSHLLQEEEPK